ncbi:MAG: hypothetical protein HY788_17935 [Deltaproteobacteria bacterium]|nr:hypothetical protein [Deltaproteobacteria bacterium]
MKKLLAVAVSLSVVLCIVIPAKADFVVGMMAYTDLGYYYRDTERMKTENPTVDGGVGDVFIDMPHHSRLYSKCTTEDCGGYFELGVGSDTETSIGFANANFRKLYGWYDFGNFRMEAGHTETLGAARYNPTQLFGLGRALHVILCGWGNIYDRAAQANLIFQSGGFYLAAGLSTNDRFGIFDGNGEEYNYIPRVHLVAGVTTPTFSILPNLTFQQAEGKDTTNKDSSAYAWVVEVPVSIKAGSFGIDLSGHWGYNVGTLYSQYYNLSYGGQNATGAVQVTPDGEVEDTLCWGGYFDASFGGNTIAVHLIAGVQHVENDVWEGEDSNTRYGIAVRIPYSISGSFTLSPEVGYYNHGDDVNVQESGKDLGTDILAGVQFQFVF